MRRGDQYENAPAGKWEATAGGSRCKWKGRGEGVRGLGAENGDPQTDCRPQAPLVPPNGEE